MFARCFGDFRKQNKQVMPLSGSSLRVLHEERVTLGVQVIPKSEERKKLVPTQNSESVIIMSVPPAHSMRVLYVMYDESKCV